MQYYSSSSVKHSSLSLQHFKYYRTIDNLCVQIYIGANNKQPTMYVDIIRNGSWYKSGWHIEIEIHRILRKLESEVRFHNHDLIKSFVPGKSLSLPFFMFVYTRFAKHMYSFMQFNTRITRTTCPQTDNKNNLSIVSQGLLFLFILRILLHKIIICAVNSRKQMASLIVEPVRYTQQTLHISQTNKTALILKIDREQTFTCK